MVWPKLMRIKNSKKALSFLKAFLPIVLSLSLVSCSDKSSMMVADPKICQLDPRFSDGFGSLDWFGTGGFHYSSNDRNISGTFSYESGVLNPYQFSCVGGCEKELGIVKSDIEKFLSFSREHFISSVIWHPKDSVLVLSQGSRGSYYLGKDVEEYLHQGSIYTFKVEEDCTIQSLLPIKK